MKSSKAVILVLLAVLTICGTLLAAKILKEKIRYPAVKGQFYPASKYSLRKEVDKYIGKNKKRITPETEIKGLIVPHAGYIYSGKTAGKGFSEIKDSKYDLVILICSGHSYSFPVLATSYHTKWQTPLGALNVDKGFIDELEKKEKIIRDDRTFINDHTLEVELPFLQRTLKPGFKIAPFLINESRISKLEKTSQILADLISKRKKVLLIMSTDMSHYYDEKTAVKMDKAVSEKIRNYDIDGLEKLILSGQGQLCGSGGVMLGLLTLEKLGADKIIQLDYSHSGTVSGDKTRVVGYGAFAVIKKNSSKTIKKGDKKMGLTEEQKMELLKIARKTIENYIETGKKPDIVSEDSLLNEERGVFVTIHKEGDLRGCIGNIIPVNKLYKAVIDMSVQSAVNDPRFPPLSKEELNNIDIEISVLTVPEKVSHEDIEIGRDGVIVKKGFRQGVYLPQVATETGWNKEEFLSSLCYSKAGLNPGAWKDSETELFSFQAEVFNEKEFGIK